ncbi:hypothetical protein BH09BAC4_BH09BAC4_39010 [soil metagenome]
MQRYAHPMFHVQMTGASNSTVGEWERMRKVGAIAKSMLIAAAAKAWNVSPDLLTTANGWVIGQVGQKIAYGELATSATNQICQYRRM